MRSKKLVALVLAGAMCLTSFVGCGVNPQETAATLGDQKISAVLVNFVCKYQKAAYDDAYSVMAGEDFWDNDLYGTGSAFKDTMKLSIVNSFHELYTVKAHMADYNVEITAEEKEAITKATQAFLKANSDEAIKEMGASEEIVSEVLTLYTIQAKMYDAITADTDRNVSDEDANMRGITLVQLGIAGEYDETGTYVKYTEDEIKAIKETAAKILTESSSVGLTQAAKDNKYEAQDTAYSKKDTSMDKTLLEALNALKEGETSKLIETATAVYIAKIDEEVDKKATEENRETIIAEREDTVYSEKLKEWQKDDGWKVNDSVIDKIEFHNILTQKDPSETNTEKADSTEGK